MLRFKPKNCATIDLVSPNRLAGATVLIVDDIPDTLRLLVKALGDEGIRVLIAIDGPTAMALLDRTIPDLILIDAMMPGMDGFAVTRLIKTKTRLAHLPVVFMSGMSDSKIIVQGLEAGGVDFVAKPIMLDQLIARLRVHLRNSQIKHGSRIALDLAGRPMMALDAECRVSWSTPAGEAILEKAFTEYAKDRTLPEHVKVLIRRLQVADEQDATTARIDLCAGWIEFTLKGHYSEGHFLFLIAEANDGWEKRLLVDRHALTPREAEVLIWISRGKPNRQISDIMCISPRTVSKHLEQVFKKLGVRNRALAAALAIETLSR